jgi:hypothetical protein
VLFYVFGKLPHALLRDRPAFATRQGGFGRRQAGLLLLLLPANEQNRMLKHCFNAGKRALFYLRIDVVLHILGEAIKVDDHVCKIASGRRSGKENRWFQLSG